MKLSYLSYPILAGLLSGSVLRAQALQFEPDILVNAPANNLDESLWWSGPLPDSNGDGVEEFFVAAPLDRVNGLFEAGQGFVYNGATGELRYTLTAPVPTIDGEFGWRAFPADDFSGDGIRDFCVLAIGNNNHLSFHNSVDGSFLFAISSPQPAQSAAFGYDFWSVSDFSGDGVEDWVIHQREYGGSGANNRGRTFIIRSSDRTLRKTIDHASFSTERFEQVVALPDLNGDGWPELGFAHRDADYTHNGTFYTDCGLGWVVSSEGGDVLYNLVDPDIANGARVFWGVNPSDDINGDGIADLLVWNFPKQPRLFSGADGSWVRDITPFLNHDYGGALQMPDINGDGIADVRANVRNPRNIWETHIYDPTDGSLIQEFANPPLPRASSLGNLKNATGGVAALLYADDRAQRLWIRPVTPPPPAPDLRALGFVGNIFQLEFSGLAGQVIDVKATEDLQNWTPLGQITLTGGPDLFEDPDAKSNGRTRRFYQGQVLPPAP